MAEVLEEPQNQEEIVQQDFSAGNKPAPAPIASSFSSLSLSIWPPSQRTREAVFGRLVQTLTTPSVLTKRYGTFTGDEADTVARRIEEEAFGTASASSDQKGGGRGEDDDGMDTLQIYSKEISKKMLDAVKARASPAATATANGSGSAPTGVTEPVVADEASADGAKEEAAETVGSDVATQA